MTTHASWFAGELILERNFVSVISMKKPSQNTLYKKINIAEKLPVVSVKQTSAKIHIFCFARKLTVKKNQINSMTIEKAYLPPYNLENVRELIVEIGHVFFKSVEKLFLILWVFSYPGELTVEKPQWI